MLPRLPLKAANSPSSAGADQLLAEQPDRVLMRRGRAQTKSTNQSQLNPSRIEELDAGVAEGVLRGGSVCLYRLAARISGRRWLIMPLREAAARRCIT